MKQRRHTPEQVIRKLAEGDKLLAEGKTIEEVARHLEISEQTYHRWRNQYGGMKANDAKRLKELEQENARLKKLLAEAELDKAMLKELETSNPGPSSTSGSRSSIGSGSPNATPAGSSASTGPPSARPGRSRATTRWPYGPGACFRSLSSPLGLEEGGRLRPGQGWRVNNKRIQRLWR